MIFSFYSYLSTDNISLCLLFTNTCAFIICVCPTVLNYWLTKAVNYS